MATAAPPEFADDHLDKLEEYLRRGDLLDAHSLVVEGGWANKCRVTLNGGVFAIQKPVKGSNAPETGSEEIGVNREVAAWRICRAFGWTNLVAATVSTDMWSPSLGATTRVCLQVIWPAPTEPALALDQLPDLEIWQAAIFDWLIVQTDRNGSNWLGVSALPEPGQSGQHRLRLHDHGHAFVPSGTLNSSFYSMKQGQGIPPTLIDDLREAERHLPDYGLDDLLGSGTTHALVTKLQQLVNDGSLL
jgi:hypothetical protein